MDVFINQWEESFHDVRVYAIITLYTLNILLFYLQLYLNKAKKKSKKLVISSVF